MISRPTVLIVGAGGSMPYEFPSGDRLLRNICEFLNPDIETAEKKMLTSMNIDVAELHRLRDDLLRSGAPSIDDFLSTRLELVDCGKKVIACALIQHERPPHVTGRGATSNWYQYLWAQLKTVTPDKLGANRITILTFNYDRSLEYYLLHAICGTWGIPEVEAAQHLARIQIIHLHGQLGRLQQLDPGGRVFSNLLSPENIALAASGITIIDEADEGNKEFDSARAALEVAAEVCFLGFGYHATNLRRLRLTPKNGRSIWGTSLGMTDAETGHVNNNFFGGQCSFSRMNILDFFRNNGVLLRN